MKLIPLTQGRFSIVDNGDYKRASKFKWHTKKCESNIYASRVIVRLGVKTTQTLHQFILGTRRGVDHKDRNGLNNRRGNLRLATHIQNSRNRKLNKNSSSGFKGVHFSPRHRKWTARISWLGEKIGLGYYAKAREAGLAYDTAANFLFKEFAATNKELCH